MYSYTTSIVEHDGALVSIPHHPIVVSKQRVSVLNPTRPSCYAGDMHNLLQPERIILGVIGLILLGHIGLHHTLHLTTPQQSDVVEIFTILEQSRGTDSLSADAAQKMQCLTTTYNAYRADLLRECADRELLSPRCSSMLTAYQEGDVVSADLESCLCTLPSELIEEKTLTFTERSRACGTPEHP